MNTRFQELVRALSKMDGAAIAFSGGVDSTFLLAAAHEALGQRLVAVIGRSPTYPERECREAEHLAQKIGARYEVVDTNELADPEFRANPPHRCFVCKSTLFGAVRAIADRHGFEQVIEGSNADDAGDFRPGMDAARRLSVRSPLLELGFTKQEIRDLSQEIGLPTWNKPALACLSSRIPYGEEINEPRLARIEQAEEALRKLGILGFRVRDHGSVARIEVLPAEIEALAKPSMRKRLANAVKAAGYSYVCLDLEGYRTGAMNEALSDEERNAARNQEEER